ncbi:predicted protein [Naegleria gruberi]|uniref:Predicted protein n=1 Tax=Naegleria gruberi TaxID=5762 RepID=D2VDE8_NAEGR|nr:uncharacterized protein NAEGRDRAFT_48595 [Naegleria gruberi]EFC45220.1 predicted protein [Naegleria gruberi]|eukprot:XP_002677964.1 predicted protein [Naegleria gruberi strain NEG-M]
MSLFDDYDFDNDDGCNSVNQWSVLSKYDDEENHSNRKQQEGKKQNPTRKKQQLNKSKSIKNKNEIMFVHGKNILQNLPLELIYQILNCLSVREGCLKIRPLNRWSESIFGMYLESGQVRELNICKEVYHRAFMKVKEGLLGSNELFNFYFRSKEEIERMKYFRSVFMGKFVNGVRRIVFDKLKDFPLGLLVKIDEDLHRNLTNLDRKKGGKSRAKKGVNKLRPKSSCLFANFETFWSGIKGLEINSSTFCNQAMSSALDFDSMDNEKSGLELLSGVISGLLQNLESLTLKNIKYTAEEAKDCELYKTFVSKVLKNSCKLTELSFEHTNAVLCEETFQIDYPNIVSLRIIDQESRCIKLCYFQKLTILEIHYYEGSMKEILSNLPHLENITLNKCILSDLECDLKFPTNLKHFDISFCKFYSLTPEIRHLVLDQLCECSQLQSLSIIKVEYIDHYCDFRNSQSDFDAFIEKLPLNLKHLQVDSLQKVQSLILLKRFIKLESLHCFGSYCRGVDNIKLIQHFHHMKDISFDCIQALGRDLSLALKDLSKYECQTTLRTIHIERWSTYDINLESKMQYIQLERLPALPNLISLQIIGYYFENEETTLRSKDPDLRSKISTNLPKLQTLIISSMISSLSGLKYLKHHPNNSIIDNSTSLENSSLLHFDFWTQENMQVQKQQLLVSKKLKKKTR